MLSRFDTIPAFDGRTDNVTRSPLQCRCRREFDDAKLLLDTVTLCSVDIAAQQSLAVDVNV